MKSAVRRLFVWPVCNLTVRLPGAVFLWCTSRGLRSTPSDRGSMTPEAVRKINLLECLLDEHPDVNPPPDDAVQAWTEGQLRDYFALTCRAAASALTEQRRATAEALPIGDNTAQTTGEASAAHRARWAGANSGDENMPFASCQPGGGVEQVVNSELDPANAPSMLRTNQLAASMDGYRRAAIADGIPFRCRSAVHPGYQPYSWSQRAV